MPRRMIRDWSDSLKFDGISAEAERLFVRLIMKADDYGRFHADPRLVKGTCFPMFENLRTEQVGRWLDELHHRNLIFRYEAENQKLLSIINFGQRLKQSRAKFPPNPGDSGNWLPTSGNFRELPGSRQKNVSEEEEEEEVEKEEKKKARAESLEEVSEYCQSLGLPKSDAEYLWLNWKENGWKRSGTPIKDWKMTIQKWKVGNFLPSQKGKQPQRPQPTQETFI